jgi:peroxiredoxin
MKKIFLVATIIATTLTSLAQDTTKPKGLMVGDKAPNIMGKTTNAGKYDLAKGLKKGPVVVLFYRGQWCPFCNKQLKQLNDSLQLLVAKGATVIAVSPETMENTQKTIEKTKVSFPVLSDEKLSIAKAYGVNFAVDAKTIEKYKGYGIDFDKANGANGANLPVPATYIIGKDGTIKFVYFNADYSKRVSVATLLGNL